MRGGSAAGVFGGAGWTGGGVSDRRNRRVHLSGDRALGESFPAEWTLVCCAILPRRRPRFEAVGGEPCWALRPHPSGFGLRWEVAVPGVCLRGRIAPQTSVQPDGKGFPCLKVMVSRTSRCSDRRRRIVSRTRCGGGPTGGRELQPAAERGSRGRSDPGPGGDRGAAGGAAAAEKPTSRERCRRSSEALRRFARTSSKATGRRRGTRRGSRTTSGTEGEVAGRTRSSGAMCDQRLRPSLHGQAVL